MSHGSTQSSTTSVRLTTVGVLTALGLLVSACSSSGTAGSGSTAPAASAPVPSTASVASVPAAGSSSAPSSTAAASSAAASSGAGGGGIDLSGSFCSAAKQEQAQSQKEATAYSGSDPASLEKLETDGVNELQKFVAIAPAAIKSDVEVIAAGDQKLFNALKAVKFMIQKVDPSVLTSLQTPAFTAAEKHITTYLATSCGITDSSTP